MNIATESGVNSLLYVLLRLLSNDLERKNEKLLGKMDKKQKFELEFDSDKIENEIVIERLCEIIANE